jgi:hypothetical protein
VPEHGGTPEVDMLVEHDPGQLSGERPGELLLATADEKQPAGATILMTNQSEFDNAASKIRMRPLRPLSNLPLWLKHLASEHSAAATPCANRRAELVSVVAPGLPLPLGSHQSHRETPRHQSFNLEGPRSDAPAARMALATPYADVAPPASSVGILTGPAPSRRSRPASAPDET